MLTSFLLFIVIYFWCLVFCGRLSPFVSFVSFHDPHHATITTTTTTLQQTQQQQQQHNQPTNPNPEPVKVTGFCRSPQETRKSSPTGSVTSSVSTTALTPSRQLTDAEKLRKVIMELVDTERTYVKVSTNIKRNIILNNFYNTISLQWTVVSAVAEIPKDYRVFEMLFNLLLICSAGIFNALVALELATQHDT